MHILAINGSPRKNRNTATLLNKALEGAASQGATTELIHLYDLNYKGCISCFSCKLTGGKSYGKCAYQDDLSPVLEKISNADAVILGSPLYFGNVTGEMKSLMERLLFQYVIYDENYSSLVTKKKQIGLIYTMNVKEDTLEERGYNKLFLANEFNFKRIFGASESLLSTNTYQFTDYSKYITSAFNEPEKAKHLQEIFPKDCEKAFMMGSRFASSPL
jgi:multimeric flavodoxin WrbA